MVALLFIGLRCATAETFLNRYFIDKTGQVPALFMTLRPGGTAYPDFVVTRSRALPSHDGGLADNFLSDLCKDSGVRQTVEVGRLG